MHRPQSRHFQELEDHKKYVVESSDVIEDLKVFVKEEGSERIFWYKERFLTDDEIVENVVENATSRICWTIHRPKRGWYIRIRAPLFPLGVSIPLAPLPASSPFHTDAALSFSTRINPPKWGRDLGPTASSSSRVSSPPTHSSKSSVETDETITETVVHSYPPTPSPGASAALGQPPSPDSVHAKLDKVSAGRDPRPDAAPNLRQFLLAPHSAPYVPEQNPSLVTKALSLFKAHRPSYSLSFTLCPMPFLEDSSSLSTTGAAQQQQHSTEGHSRQRSLARIGELVVPPTLPALITFHDRSPAWSLGSFSGLLDVDTTMERELGVDRSFWVTVVLAYMEFLVERESYLAASGG